MVCQASVQADLVSCMLMPQGLLQWQRISEEMKHKYTPAQCLARYRQGHCFSRQKQQHWPQAEDIRLADMIKLHGEGKWKVSSPPCDSLQSVFSTWSSPASASCLLFLSFRPACTLPVWCDHCNTVRGYPQACQRSLITSIMLLKGS